MRIHLQCIRLSDFFFVCVYMRARAHTPIGIYGFKFSAASDYLISSDWPLSGRLGSREALKL